MILRHFALILFWFTSVSVSFAAETNYVCIVCAKGPLTGQIWLHPRGTICDDCHKLENRCSLCGLPVRDGFAKTGDGRFICQRDKPNAVLEVEAAREIFEKTRDELVDLYGRRFLLKYPEVTVNMFDVDYWTEKGHENGLDKYGFASTRQTPSGHCTHEVVLLSGQWRDQTIASAAHEYTHLWINENRPRGRVIDGGTIEAICELTAYKLMGKKNLPEMQQSIVDNPYTRGKIKTLVALDKRYDTDHLLDWVKHGKTETLEEDIGFALPSEPAPLPYVPPPLPEMLKFNGMMTIGKTTQAVINGVTFTAGEQKPIKLRNQTVLVRCREIQKAAVVLELNNSPERFTLKQGEAKSLP